MLTYIMPSFFSYFDIQTRQEYYTDYFSNRFLVCKVLGICRLAEKLLGVQSGLCSTSLVS